jgi:hypothetical protein
MSKVSKRVSARLSNAEHTIQATQTHGAKAAAGVAPRLPGFAAADVERLIVAVAACLLEATNGLRGQEQAYADEQADDPAALDARDSALGALRGELLEVRGFIRKHAPGRLKGLGLEGELPEGHADFVLHAKNVAKQLSDAGGEVQGPFKMTLNLKEVGALLGERVQTLHEALGAVSQERKELEVALIERDRALAQWQLVYSAVGDILSGLYRLGGEAALGARLRPTQRRVRGEVVMTPEEGADQPIDDAEAANAQPQEAAADATTHEPSD